MTVPDEIAARKSDVVVGESLPRWVRRWNIRDAAAVRFENVVEQ
jgi:hypothetical protein